jgi:hypothetical protein
MQKFVIWLIFPRSLATRLGQSELFHGRSLMHEKAQNAVDFSTVYRIQ